MCSYGHDHDLAVHAEWLARATGSVLATCPGLAAFAVPARLVSAGLPSPDVYTVDVLVWSSAGRPGYEVTARVRGIFHGGLPDDGMHRIDSGHDPAQPACWFDGDMTVRDAATGLDYGVEFLRVPQPVRFFRDFVDLRVRPDEPADFAKRGIGLAREFRRVTV